MSAHPMCVFGTRGVREGTVPAEAGRGRRIPRTGVTGSLSSVVVLGIKPRSSAGAAGVLTTELSVQVLCLHQALV